MLSVQPNALVSLLEDVGWRASLQKTWILWRHLETNVGTAGEVHRWTPLPLNDIYTLKVIQQMSPESQLLWVRDSIGK